MCHHLAAKGLRCYLGSKIQIGFLIERLSNYIYIDKGYHAVISDGIYAQIKKNNGLVVSLDEEGAVDYPDGSTLKRRYAPALFENADLVFLWGAAQLELIRGNINQNKKVKVTGHPRFEMLKSEFHHLYNSDVLEIKKRFGKYILINTNMGFGNNIRGDAFVESNYRGRFKGIKDNISFDKLKLKAYIQLVGELLKITKNNIIIRPHPEEERRYYIEAFKENRNVHVLYEGPVIPWLLAADKFIHPDCTTGIESLFLGKKPISYLPSDYPRHLVTHLPLKASNLFTSQSELISFLKQREGPSEVIELSDYAFAEEYFSINKPSTKTIAEQIAELGKISNTKSLSITELLQLKLFSFKSQIPRWSKSSLLGKNKLSGFSTNSVKTIHSKLNKNISGVKFEALNNQLFFFQEICD